MHNYPFRLKAEIHIYSKEAIKTKFSNVNIVNRRGRSEVNSLGLNLYIKIRQKTGNFNKDPCCCWPPLNILNCWCHTAGINTCTVQLKSKLPATPLFFFFFWK